MQIAEHLRGLEDRIEQLSAKVDDAISDFARKTLLGIGYSFPVHWIFNFGTGGLGAYQLRGSTDVYRFEKAYKNSFPKISNARILDIGCSTGITTEYICKIYPDSEVIGIDLNTRALRKARSEPHRAKYLKADGFHSDFPDCYFDAVFCNNAVLWRTFHLQNMQDMRPYREIRTLVKDQGHLLISAHHSSAIYQKAEGTFILKNKNGFVEDFVLEALNSNG